MKKLDAITMTWVAIGLSFLFLTLYSGVLLDYGPYLEEWRLVYTGADPWIDAKGEPTPNYYGPLFNALAPLVLVHYLVPKIIFCLAWLLLGYWFWVNLQRRSRGGELSVPKGFFKWVFIVSPFFWLEIPVYGHFDVLIAASVVGTLHFIRRGREVSAGIALASGILIKFIPVVILPFLCFPKNGFRRRFLFSCLGAIAAGFVISWLLWGDSTFSSFDIATRRDSKLTSIFMFLRGRYSPLGWFVENPNVDFLSVPLLLLFLMTTFVVFYVRHWNEIAASVFALHGTFLIYKVGHPQFQTILFALVIYYFIFEFRPFSRAKQVGVSLFTYFIWYNLYLLTYFFTDGINQYPWDILRHLGGLPTFVLGSWVAVELWRVLELSRAQENKIDLSRPTAVPNLPLDSNASVGSQIV